MPFKRYALWINAIQNVCAFGQYHPKRTRFRSIPFKKYLLSINTIQNVRAFDQYHSKGIYFQSIPFKMYLLSINTIQNVCAFDQCLWKSILHLIYKTEDAWHFQYMLSKACSHFQSIALKMHSVLNINNWHCLTCSVQAIKNNTLTCSLSLPVNKMISFYLLSDTVLTMQSKRFNKRGY